MDFQPSKHKQEELSLQTFARMVVLKMALGDSFETVYEKAKELHSQPDRAPAAPVISKFLDYDLW